MRKTTSTLLVLAGFCLSASGQVWANEPGLLQSKHPNLHTAFLSVNPPKTSNYHLVQMRTCTRADIPRLRKECYADGDKTYGRMPEPIKSQNLRDFRAQCDTDSYLLEIFNSNICDKVR